MPQLTDQAALRDLLERHGFHTSKALGQNFLINPTVCPRMARACGACEPGIVGALEIGPGVGVLTRELSAVAQKVVSIELDRRLFPVLEETLADGCSNVELVQGDVLKLDLASLVEERFAPRKGEKIVVCANLPYYITSPVILGLLESGLPVAAMTFLVQKEAAQRICAQPGERACGAVSAAVWYRARPKILFPVGRGSFSPVPRVDSAVIRLTMRQTPPVSVSDEAGFFALVRAAFAQRRKTAANSVSAAGRVSKARVEEALAAAGIEKSARAESLTLSQWAAVFSYLSFGQDQSV